MALTCLLLTCYSQASDQPVELKRAGNRIDVVLQGRPFTSYYFGPESPKPYFHPLHSSQGTIVTRGFPMVNGIRGESHDHPHHRGMFFTQGDINGIDFWGEAEFAEKSPVVIKGKPYSSIDLPKGRTVFRKLEEMRVGSGSGSIRARFDLVGPDGKVIASETQAYTISAIEANRIIDCTFTLFADRGGARKVGRNHEGP